MGWRTVADVRDYSRATGAAYVVGVMLAERAPDETRVARPGLDRLALDARCGRSTVKRALDTLEGLGEIRELAAKVGRGNVNQYEVLVGPGLYGGVTYKAFKKGGQSGPVTEKGAHLGQKGAHLGGGGVGEKGAQGGPRTELPPTPEPKGTDTARPEVARLCELMAGLSNARTDPDGTRPEPKYTVTQAWLDEMRRLIDIDGRDPELIERAIRWVDRHPFWGSNVLAVPTLRKQFDKLYLQAKRESENGKGEHPASRRIRTLRETSQP